MVLIALILGLYHFHINKWFNFYTFDTLFNITMMNFTEQEKVSILKAMDALIKADNNIDEKEVQYLEVIVEEFDWDARFLDKLDGFKISDAVEAVKNISPEKLNYFKAILQDLAASDNEINHLETELIDKIDQFILENSKS